MRKHITRPSNSRSKLPRAANKYVSVSSMIPADKHDEASIKLLQIASDEEVLENAEKLLEWLQDINWPVFEGIAQRLSSLGDDLVAPITRILESSDSIWKANVIGYLIPSFSPETQKLYIESLEKLLAQRDDSDLREGVIGFVEIQLSNTKKNT